MDTLDYNTGILLHSYTAGAERSSKDPPFSRNAHSYKSDDRVYMPAPLTINETSHLL